MVANVQSQSNGGRGDNQALCPAPAAKPQVVRVALPDGGVRFVGIAAAARWLRCTPQALGQLARGKPFYAGGPLERRAREEFPELFGNGGG